jgi:hypothetical protein
MTNFKSYYILKFREDINSFISSIPDESKYHEDIENRQFFSIQYERLTPKFNHLDFLEKENKEYFAVALFFTILTDMVCYTHYRSDYIKFNNLTKYPKLIGNCLSWCRFHLHPRDIFIAMNYGRNSSEEHLIFINKFLEAIDPMKEEIIDFFDKHLIEINGNEFWNKCKTEFPY